MNPDIFDQIVTGQTDTSAKNSLSEDVFDQIVMGDTGSMFPEKEPITQNFGNYNPDYYSGSGLHQGTDFGTKPGEPISVPHGNWIVEEAYNGAGEGNIGDWTNQGYGNSVVVRNKDTGEKIRISHLQKVNVSPGQEIKGGTIGVAGGSGHVDGPHTDIEYIDQNNNVGDVLSSPYGKYLPNF